MGAPPPPGVLAGFGVTGAVGPLPGGRGLAWRSDRLVLKPVDDPAEHAWVSAVTEAWPDDAAVAVPRPVRSRTGDLVVEGWSAEEWLPGTTARAGDDPTWFRTAAEAFHAVTADLPRPDFLDDRDDPWARGDRVAWEGRAPTGPTELVELVEECLAGLPPSTAPVQVVHGDLTPNVLRDGDAAAVIDWPPYVRTTGWALAVVAVDALCWQGADSSLLEVWGDVPEWGPSLRRALAYRLATRGELGLGALEVDRERATLARVRERER